MKTVKKRLKKRKKGGGREIICYKKNRKKKEMQICNKSFVIEVLHEDNTQQSISRAQIHQAIMYFTTWHVSSIPWTIRPPDILHESGIQLEKIPPDVLSQKKSN